MWDWAYKGKKPADNDDNNKPPLVQPPPVEPAEDRIADAPDNEDEKAIVDGPFEKASLADAATLDVTDDSGEPLEGKLAPVAVNSNDDATMRQTKTTTFPVHAEANRKRQMLEREKRLLGRTQPGAQPLNVEFAHALIPATHTVRHPPPR